MHHDVHGKKVIVMDATRLGLEGELRNCFEGNSRFSITQLTTPRGGCRAIQNANGSAESMIVAVGDMHGVQEADKAALLQNLWLQLGVKPTKIINFTSAMPAEKLAEHIASCVTA